MAFPTVVGATENDCAGNPGTNIQAVMPAGIVAGDLILVLTARDTQNGTGTPQAGFAAVSAATANGTGYGATWLYKVATGGESGTITVATITSDRWATMTYVIRGYTGLPVESAWSAAAVTNSPNAPNLVTGFGAVDTLWLLAAAADAGGKTLTAPAGYSNVLDVPATGTGGMSISTARKTSTAASDDPAAATWSGTAANANANVLAVQGVAAPPPAARAQAIVV